MQQLKHLLVVVAALVATAAGALEMVDDNLLGSVLEACPDSASSLPCQGVRALRRAAKTLEGDAPISLAQGVSLVKVGDEGGARAGGFLQSRELRVSLPQLIGADAWGRFLNSSLLQPHSGVDESRKNKGGGGGLGYAMMGMMMWMMGSMALGGLGLMAMKALALSAMAMLLAAVAAVKKLAGGNDDGGHHVSVVPVHGGGHDYHRRRRDADILAYRAHHKQS